MTLNRRGIHLDIDPDRPLAMILLELVVGLGRRGAAWLRRHPRLTLSAIAALAGWVGGPALAHHAGAIYRTLVTLLGAQP